MPNIKSAKKRVRLSEERRVHKKHYTTGMRTLIKRVVTAIEAGDKETATEAAKAGGKALTKSQLTLLGIGGVGAATGIIIAASSSSSSP